MLLEAFRSLRAAPRVTAFILRRTDVRVYLVVGGALAASAFLAVLLPARRASRVDPLLALRSE